ncbi:MAG: ferredoxin [Actinomycetes bacterium]
MRIVVDRDLCQGHGVCESEASSIFEVPKRATTVTLLNERPSDEQRAEVLAAVKFCPTHALRMIEEE